jgi:hypothetical protein
METASNRFVVWKFQGNATQVFTIPTTLHLRFERGFEHRMTLYQK